MTPIEIINKFNMNNTIDLNEPIETNDYWIINEYLIFKPKFNKSLDKIYEFIKQMYTFDIFKLC